MEYALASNRERLNGIYATDALSFLPRHWLDRCRWVSSHYNGTIVAGRGSGKLRARVQFDHFYLAVTDTGEDFTPDGFGRIVEEKSGRDWRTIREYHHCCGDWLPTAAHRLTGQKIFLSAEPNAYVLFHFRRRSHWGMLGLAVSLRNELTSASAATLLHFIHHVHEQLYFNGIWLSSPADGLDTCGRFNPAILSSMAVAKKQPIGGWVRAVGPLDRSDRTDRLFQSLPRQDALRDIVTVRNLQAAEFVLPTHTSAFIQFVTQCGSCVTDELAVHLEQSNRETHEQRVDFLGQVVKSLSEVPDLRHSVRRLHVRLWDLAITLPDIVDILRPFLATDRAAFLPDRVTHYPSGGTSRTYLFGPFIRSGSAKKSHQQLCVKAYTSEHPRSPGREEVTSMDFLVSSLEKEALYRPPKARSTMDPPPPIKLPSKVMTEIHRFLSFNEAHRLRDLDTASYREFTIRCSKISRRWAELGHVGKRSPSDPTNDALWVMIWERATFRWKEEAAAGKAGADMGVPGLFGRGATIFSEEWKRYRELDWREKEVWKEKAKDRLKIYCMAADFVRTG